MSDTGSNQRTAEMARPILSDQDGERDGVDGGHGSFWKGYSRGLQGTLRGYLGLHRERLGELVGHGGVGCGAEAGRRAVAMYDGMLGTLFLAARSLSESRSLRKGEISLAAVGSYGRGTFALASDLDIRLLHDGNAEQARALADALLYPLWDIRVSVGHQVVAAAELMELARTDLRTMTTLLDWRHIVGDEPFWDRVRDRATARLFSPAGLSQFLTDLERETAERHERFGGSVYLLEPDVKNGPGGMRDLDVALWVARARWRTDRFEDLVRLGVLVPHEVAEIVDAREHLWRVRNQLHILTQRRVDRLSFEQQERLAELLDHGSDKGAVESFMSEHYRHASTVMRAQSTLFERAAEVPRIRRAPEMSVSRVLTLFDGQLAFASTQALVSDPSIALDLYREAVARDVPIYAGARRALRRALQLPSFRQSIHESPQARTLFASLCSVVKNTRLQRDSILGDMHDVGLLTAMIPEFLPVVGRVHHDAYHVLTVDMHSITAVDRLRALARGDLAAAFPLACRLAVEIARPHVLFLATLLHDVGKAIGRHDHAQRGAACARTIASRLGLAHSDAAQVAQLVSEHLTLYHLATRRDIHAPPVVQEAIGAVQDREGLRELYLLTFVDVATTSPEAMTAWKAGLLDALFVEVDAALRGDPSSASDRAKMARDQVREHWRQLGESQNLSAFVEGMPKRYWLATPRERILQHARVVASRPTGQAVVEMLEPTSGASAELCVVADDRPGLLAAMAAALSANRLEVLKAQIYSRARNDGVAEAIDLFQVRSAGEVGSDELRRIAGKVERDLGALLGGELSAEEIVRARRQAVHSERHTPTVETKVSVDTQPGSHLTVIEVITRDRPGLLHALASALRDLRLSIEIAIINTEGTKVIDVFYVCEVGGTKLESTGRTDEVVRRVKTTLEQLAKEGS